MRCRAAPQRDVAADRLADRGLGGGAIARQAAIGPFDAAVAERHAGLGQHDQAALEAVQPRDLLEPLVRGLVDRLRDAHDDVRRRDQLAEARRRERLDLGERLGGDQLRRELARDRDRDLDGFGFEPRLDRLQALRQRRDALRDALAGGRGAALDLRLGGEQAVAVGLGLGARERRLVRGERDRRLRGRRAIAGGEVVLEQEFDRRAHRLHLNRPALRRRGSSRS